MYAEQQGGTARGARHVTVGEDSSGQRLDNFLIRVLANVPRSRVYRLVRKGEVRVNGRRAKPEQRLQTGDDVRVPPVRMEEQSTPGRVPQRLMEAVTRSIIHEDDRVLVLDKPSGVAVHGGSGLSFGVIEALRAARPQDDLELVHRLDRDTSGCLIVARKRSALRVLHELLREGRFEKRYLVLVKGKWELGHKRIDVPLRTDTRVSGERTVRAHASGKEAISEFRPVQFFGTRASLLEVSIHTGRTHQIRVHAAHVGHPVAGDEKYGDAEFNESLRGLGLQRMFLHASSVGFEWPQGGEFSVNAPLPPELASVIDTLAVTPSKRGRTGGGRKPYNFAQARRAAPSRPVGAGTKRSGKRKPGAPKRARNPDQR